MNLNVFSPLPLAAALSLGVFAPPAGQSQPQQPSATYPMANHCTVLGAMLQGTVNDLNALMVKPAPDAAGAVHITGTVLKLATDLQVNRCLPAVPPGPGQTVNACTDHAADLYANLYGNLAALISVGTPDTKASAGDTATVKKIYDQMVADNCLPKNPS